MITFAEKQFDFGTVKYGTFPEREITITNSGDKVVQVNCTNTSCSCTQGSVNPNPVQANGSSKAIISLSTTKAGIGNNQSKSAVFSWSENGQRFSETIKFKVNIVK